MHMHADVLAVLEIAVIVVMMAADANTPEPTAIDQVISKLPSPEVPISGPHKRRFESSRPSQLLSILYCIYYCLSRKPILSRICGVYRSRVQSDSRDGCTRDFGCGRYENLSGAISWLTFFAGGAADVRRSRSDWRRELAESTICCQRKPSSFRWSAQPAGSRGVRRINVWAVSCDRNLPKSLRRQ